MEPLGPRDPWRVGAYRLLARLGGGGMGTVYLGRTEGGRTVAVKLIRGEYAQDEEFRRRFRKEVATARQVGGAWSPAVLDADTEGPRPWVATAYVPGPDLGEALRRFGPLPLATVRVLGAGLAEALAAVHRLGLVHRDVKPSNVLLSPDGPRLIDFGIARALDAGTAGLTRSGHVMGSPAFMSPEQAAGAAVGAASDVFSLGAVLATAATGRNPFGAGANAAVLLYRVRHDPPALEGLPDALRDLVTACLDKSPERRPVAEQLGQWLLPDPDVTVRHGSWLPPALADAVARVATDVLHLDAPPPAVAAPTFPAPSFPTPSFPAPSFPTPSFPAPGPAVPVRRPSRRARAAGVALVTATLTATAAWAVMPSSPAEGRAGVSATGAARPPEAAPPTTPDTGPAPTPPDTGPVSAAPEVPAAFVGTWAPPGAPGGTNATATATLTIRRGRVGALVATASVSGASYLCRYTFRLTAAEPTRIALTLADLVTDGGGGCPAASPAPDGGRTQLLTLLSASALRIDGGGTVARLTKRGRGGTG